MVHPKWLGLLVLTSLISASCGEEGDQTAWRAEILGLHRSAIQAHLDKDAVLLSKPISPEYISVADGLIQRQDAEEVEQALSDYLSHTEFSHYEDLVGPIIGVSEDGTLAWLLAQVRVAGVRERSDSDPVAFDTQWAWLTLYQRVDGEWKRIADVSTNRSFDEGS